MVGVGPHSNLQSLDSYIANIRLRLCRLEVSVCIWNPIIVIDFYISWIGAISITINYMYF